MSNTTNISIPHLQMLRPGDGKEYRDSSMTTHFHSSWVAQSAMTIYHEKEFRCLWHQPPSWGLPPASSGPRSDSRRLVDSSLRWNDNNQSIKCFISFRKPSMSNILANHLFPADLWKKISFS